MGFSTCPASGYSLVSGDLDPLTPKTPPTSQEIFEGIFWPRVPNPRAKLTSSLWYTLGTAQLFEIEDVCI
jgi:hypothetical protein